MIRCITKLLAVLLPLILLAGCSLPAARPGGNVPEIGQLDYEVIDISSSQFQELAQGELGTWYEQNHKAKGLHSFTSGEYRYLLISAGEKPTGGYYLEDLVLTGKEKEIEVKVKLHSPAKDEMVTQVITYPHMLVRIPDDGRELAFAGIEGDSTAKEPEIHKDSGRFIGQIDSNSIEVKISGVPDELPARAFRLDDKVKESFAKLGLQEGDQIIFSYIINEHQQHIIIEIDRLK